MPSRLTDERCEAIAQAYQESGYDKTNGLRAIKKADGSQFYSDSYCLTLGHKIYNNIRVVEAIKRIKDKIEQKFEHNYEKAVKMIEERIGWLNEKAKTGNVQAIQAQTALIRELDDITGLKQQNINITTDQQRELTERESKDAKKVANILNLQELREA